MTSGLSDLALVDLDENNGRNNQRERQTAASQQDRQ
jgi:hypothetical protein